MTEKELGESYNPSDTLTLTFAKLGEACADAARAGAESERIGIAERVNNLIIAAAEGDQDAHLSEGLTMAHKAIVGWVAESA